MPLQACPRIENTKHKRVTRSQKVMVMDASLLCTMKLVNELVYEKRLHPPSKGYHIQSKYKGAVVQGQTPLLTFLKMPFGHRIFKYKQYLALYINIQSRRKGQRILYSVFSIPPCLLIWLHAAIHSSPPDLLISLPPPMLTLAILGWMQLMW